MSALFIPKLYVRPDSELEIVEKAQTLLVRAECLGTLPTPIDRLFETAKISEVELDRSEMLSLWTRFSAGAKRMVSGAMGIINQIRGAADLRRRVVFMPRDDSRARVFFARAHELGHLALPWHKLNEDYLDSDKTLSHRINERFEIEANLFAAETVFQGARFKEMARQYSPDFASNLELANRHGTSLQATFWRFAEVHDEALAGVTYYPAKKGATAEAVQAGFVIYKFVRSTAFAKRFGSMTVPGRLDAGHEWATARFARQQPMLGEIPLQFEGRAEPFLWEAFWNGYCLMVLVRRKPVLHSLARLIGRAA